MLGHCAEQRPVRMLVPNLPVSWALRGEINALAQTPLSLEVYHR